MTSPSDRTERGSRLARRILAAVICAGFAMAAAANLPGHLSYDSVLQLAQGRAGVYNAWHPPVMAWLLGLFDQVVRGAGLFVLFDALLLFGGLLALVRLEPDPSWAAIGLGVVFVLTPQWLIYPGIVWKDVLFAGAALMGFALLALAAASWRARRLRAGLITAAVFLLSLAALARQNGAVAAVFGAVALGVIATRATGSLARGVAYGAGTLAACGMIVMAGGAALSARGDGEPSRLYQLEDLQTYDLAAALKAQPGLRLEPLEAKSPELAHILRAQGARAYTPIRIDPLAGLPELQAAVSETPPTVLSQQWRALIFGRPDLYLKVRAVDFAWVFFTPRIKACLPFYVGVDGPQPWMSRLGLTRREDARDRLLREYGEALAWTPVYSHALYAFVAIIALTGLVLRRRPADIAVAAMLLGALAFTASFFVVSVACDYRYLYFLDVAAMASAVYVAAGWRRTDAAAIRAWLSSRGRRGAAGRPEAG